LLHEKVWTELDVLDAHLYLSEFQEARKHALIIAQDARKLETCGCAVAFLASADLAMKTRQYEIAEEILEAALLFPDFQKSSAQCWNDVHQLLLRLKARKSRR
jgi:hypothetical protein